MALPELGCRVESRQVSRGLGTFRSAGGIEMARALPPVAVLMGGLADHATTALAEQSVQIELLPRRAGEGSTGSSRQATAVSGSRSPSRPGQLGAASILMILADQWMTGGQGTRTAGARQGYLPVAGSEQAVKERRVSARAQPNGWRLLGGGTSWPNRRIIRQIRVMGR